MFSCGSSRLLFNAYYRDLPYNNLGRIGQEKFEPGIRDYPYKKSRFSRGLMKSEISRRRARFQQYGLVRQIYSYLQAYLSSIIDQLKKGYKLSIHEVTFKLESNKDTHAIVVYGAKAGGWLC